MKKRTSIALGVVGGLAILSANVEAPVAQTAAKNLSAYTTTKGNRLALDAARALAAKDCKGKITTTATKPDKNGGRVNFTCAKDEWSVILHFMRVPGSTRLLPKRFNYAG